MHDVAVTTGCLQEGNVYNNDNFQHRKLEKNTFSETKFLRNTKTTNAQSTEAYNLLAKVNDDAVQ